MDSGGGIAVIGAGLTRQPDSPAKQLTIMTGGGVGDFPVDLTFTGTDEDNVGIVETVTFTDNGFKITSKVFKTVTSIGTVVPGGYSDSATFTIQARARGNEPIFSKVAVKAGFNPSFQPTTNLIDKIRYPTSGMEEEAHSEIYFNRDEFTPILRDIFSSSDLGDWEVIHIATWLQSHYKLRAKRL